MLQTPLYIGSLLLPHRLIQGPLAGYSCAPFRQLFSLFTPPAYCVSEMLSAHDVVYKHHANHRYLYRAEGEPRLCYQISGTDPGLMAEAALKLEGLQADLIDINAGCPKAKIRKKGAGSALLEDLTRLYAVVSAVRQAIRCPLTVKIRLQGNETDQTIAKTIADAGADALIIHGRRWVDDYAVPCDWDQIRQLKEVLAIPVIANGDITSQDSLQQVGAQTGCDAVMISRASTGQPWLFQSLLTNTPLHIEWAQRVHLFMHHLEGLAALESEYQAVLQSKSLGRYYFKAYVTSEFLQGFYQLSSLSAIEEALAGYARD